MDVKCDVSDLKDKVSDINCDVSHLKDKIFDVNWWDNINLGCNAGLNITEAGFIYNNRVRISKLENKLNELQNKYKCIIDLDESELNNTMAGFIFNSYKKITKLEEELKNRHHCGINMEINGLEFIFMIDDVSRLKERVESLEKENNRLRSYLSAMEERMAKL